MWPFYILLLAPIAIQHFSIDQKNIRAHYDRKNQWALGIFFLLLTLLVMFRHESVGNDTQNYIAVFKASELTSWHSLDDMSMEIGYLYFNKLISLISDNPRFFIAVTAVCVNIMIYPTYRRLCVDSTLTIVLLCTTSLFVMMFSGIRQMLAVGIGVVAYELARNKRLIAFALCVLLAMTLHTSAFMLIFMYPLYHAKITKKWLFVVVPIVALIFVFNEQIFSILGLLIEEYTEYNSTIRKTNAYTSIVLFLLFTVFSFLVPDESSLDKETLGLRNLLLLVLIIQFFAPLHALAMRMNYYYIIFIPLLLPKIINCASERWKQVAVVGRHIMVVFLGLYFFISALDGENLNVFPYHFWGENV